jgi:hypothetical protein
MLKIKKEGMRGMNQAVLTKRRKRWFWLFGIVGIYLLVHLLFGFSLGHFLWRLLQVFVVGILLYVVLRFIWPFLLAGVVILILSYF